LKRIVVNLLLVCVLLAASFSTVAAAPRYMGINVLLNTGITDSILTDLENYGRVLDTIPSINALTMRILAADLDKVQALPYVAVANPDAERQGGPVTTASATDFAGGISTWDMDAVNVTDFGVSGRTVGFDGEGVYVAVLDTGLLKTWRNYFPQTRIAVEYGISFGGGGGEKGFVSTQPNKWEQDVNSHGTHVTSTILGYNLGGTPVNGVAPKATVIPVKVMNQNGSGWSSVVAAGIAYVGDLKAGPLKGYPVVINMSLGGPVLDAVEQAAIDYAIAQGVIIVASAGNYGDSGMGYPGAYEPVISVAASGWTGEWVGGRTWWFASDVADPTDPDDFYITDFSSRAKPGQDLDVAAPGSWIVGPYQVNRGQLSYYFLGGTSMAAPHVAGIAALMAQKYPALTATQAEEILVSSAIYLPAGCRTIVGPSAVSEEVCWGTDATGSGLATADAALGALP
jgi:subtilisin family serine protease